MYLSKNTTNYGITTTDYNELCRDSGVVPIYGFNKYFINNKLEVFTLKGYGVNLDFVKLTPSRHATHKIPMYRLVTDDGLECTQRVDYLYLSTWYGPMPIDNIHYTENEVFSLEKNLYYSINTIVPVDDSTKIINGIEFKRIYGDVFDIFVSRDGVIFNPKYSKFMKHYVNNKLLMIANP